MKTWKTKRRACRSRRSGRFVKSGLCKAFKRTLVRAARPNDLFSL